MFRSDIYTMQLKTNNIVTMMSTGRPFKFILDGDIKPSIKKCPTDETAWKDEHQYDQTYSLWEDPEDWRLYFKVATPNGDFVKSGWWIDQTNGDLHVKCSNQSEKYTPFEYNVKFFFTKVTPKSETMKRWKVAKERSPNTVILVHIGMFYEVFDEDAQLFHDLFDFPLMCRSEYAHTGFPEKSLAKYKKALEEKDIEYIVVN